MFRRSICLLLLLVVCMQSFNRLGISVAFKINQNYISSSLCENRDKPSMHCNGKCILMKKLKLAEQNEEKQRNENLEQANVLFFCKLSRLEVEKSVINVKTDDFNAFYLKFIPSPFPTGIFKPPQLITV